MTAVERPTASPPARTVVRVGWQVDGSLAYPTRQRLVGLFKDVYDSVLPAARPVATSGGGISLN